MKLYLKILRGDVFTFDNLGRDMVLDDFKNMIAIKCAFNPDKIRYIKEEFNSLK